MKLDETFNLLATNCHFSFFPSPFFQMLKFDSGSETRRKLMKSFKIFQPSKSNVVTSEPTIKRVRLHIYFIFVGYAK